MVGAEADYTFHDETIEIMEKSTIYLYTDGVFEIKLTDGRWLKNEDLENILAQNLNKQEYDLDMLYTYIVDLHAGNTLDDDFTIVKIHTS
jgi:sigma-B regulation protein RsbU (phosphoserine phosphatase)